MFDIKQWEAPPDQGFHLAEIEGFLAEGDERLAVLRSDAIDDIRYWPIGGYAVPLTAEELAPSSGNGTG